MILLFSLGWQHHQSDKYQPFKFQCDLVAQTYESSDALAHLTTIVQVETGTTRRLSLLPTELHTRSAA